MTYRSLFMMIAFALMSNFWSTELLAQPAVYAPRRVRWAHYDPYYAITNRVFAQASLIRAQGDAAVSYSTARNLNASAYSEELDNWKKRVRTYWDTKFLVERKKMELDHVNQIKRMKFLNDILGRPSNERPFLLLVVGHPAKGVQVPAIKRKSLDDFTSYF